MFSYRRRRVALFTCFVFIVIVYSLVARNCTSSKDARQSSTSFRVARPLYLETDLSTDKGKPSNNTIVVEEDKALEDVLQRVLRMLPDEESIRKLLMPIVGSGKERLHELANRTRAYKQLFEAWEELHLVPVGRGYYVRSDVVQYLQRLFPTLEEPNSGLAETVRQYEAYNSLIHELGALLFQSTAPYYGDHMALHSQFYQGGRGIVLSAGNDHTLFLVTSIRAIRSLGCQLPIEIMYLGDDDLDRENQQKLERLPGVITRDIRRMVDDKDWQLKGWAGKPWAILLSSFREVIFVDADAQFFQNPEILFEDPDYAQTGALFFHDRLMMKESKRDWLKETLPKPFSDKVRQSRFWMGQSAHMQESGVVVIDKWKHFIALLLVARMNGPDRDGNKDKGITGVYDMLFGDKETFWIGWELVGDLDYSFHGGLTGVMGTLTPETAEVKETGTREITTTGPAYTAHTYNSKVNICAPQLLHMDYDGAPLWWNGWIVENKFKHEESKLQSFERYMREPARIQNPESWQLGSDNMCCLSGLETFEFSKNETQVINNVFQIAIEVGAYTPPKK